MNDRVVSRKKPTEQANLCCDVVTHATNALVQTAYPAYIPLI